METPPAAKQPSLASLFISSVEHRHDELRRRPRRLDATGGPDARRSRSDRLFLKVDRLAGGPSCQGSASCICVCQGHAGGTWLMSTAQRYGGSGDRSEPRHWGSPARRNINGIISVVIVGIVTLSIGLFGFSLVHVLLAMMPVSLVAAWLTRPR